MWLDHAIGTSVILPELIHNLYVYKGLYISLLKNCYCITYYTSIIAELRLLVNYFVYFNNTNLCSYPEVTLY